jgi:hypothetical protein
MKHVIFFLIMMSGVVALDAIARAHGFPRRKIQAAPRAPLSERVLRKHPNSGLKQWCKKHPRARECRK